MNRPVRILALAGSYRRGSFNQALVSAAREESPENVDFREFDLREVPFYDGDVEEAGLPPNVERLKAAVRDADALLLVTPEYNSGIPAVLKNGIDWASRVYPNAPISGKVVAIMGATPGRSATELAQQQLRQVVGRTGAVVLDESELMVAKAGDVIEQGRVRSEELRSEVRAVVEALAAAVELCVDQGSLSAVM
jgi:chromate reductase